MQVPAWLTIGIAVLVIIFGAYRLWLATRPRTPAGTEAEGGKRAGLYHMSSKSHLVVGTLYLLLGGVLIATSLGFNPFSKAAPAPKAKDDVHYKVINLDDLPPPPAVAPDAPAPDATR